MFLQVLQGAFGGKFSLAVAIVNVSIGYPAFLMCKRLMRARSFCAIGVAGGRSDALFNVACAYARKGNKDEAFNKLRLAVTAGFNRRGQLERGPDLASLRGDARYQQLVEAQ